MRGWPRRRKRGRWVRETCFAGAGGGGEKAVERRACTGGRALQLAGGRAVDADRPPTCEKAHGRRGESPQPASSRRLMRAPARPQPEKGQASSCESRTGKGKSMAVACVRAWFGPFFPLLLPLSLSRSLTRCWRPWLLGLHVTGDNRNHPTALAPLIYGLSLSLSRAHSLAHTLSRTPSRARRACMTKIIVAAAHGSIDGTHQVPRPYPECRTCVSAHTHTLPSTLLTRAHALWAARWLPLGFRGAARASPRRLTQSRRAAEAPESVGVWEGGGARGLRERRRSRREKGSRRGQRQRQRERVRLWDSLRVARVNRVNRVLAGED